MISRDISVGKSFIGDSQTYNKCNIAIVRKKILAIRLTVNKSDIARGNDGISRDISVGKAVSDDSQTYNKGDIAIARKKILAG